VKTGEICREKGLSSSEGGGRNPLRAASKREELGKDFHLTMGLRKESKTAFRKKRESLLDQKEVEGRGN